MVRVLVVVAFVACARPVATEPTHPPCVEPPGDTLRWAAAWCEYKNGTDDFESEAVSRCMQATPPAELAHASACEQKRYYRAEICKIIKADEPRCADEATYVPDVVTNGVGG